MASKTFLILATLLISSFIVPLAVAEAETDSVRCGHQSISAVRAGWTEENAQIHFAGPRKMLQQSSYYRTRPCDPSIQYC
ncbi:uncharacterized protein A4U43_C03F29670 [Asparagus officinalis]|uniref:Uncharacterized protein n=1 Tax=Asparagus officinalis TaxID=4686 RepID=A0A5P1FDY1_ASPOF|nr:uncharacterized protein A4U43_C03F29670 [Asparagus officinalis]